MGREIHKRAATIDTSDTGPPVEKPIQSRVQASRIENSGGTEKGQVAGELRERVRDEKGIREGCVAKRGGRKRRGLNNSRGHGKEMGVGVKGERDSAKLRGEGDPSYGAIRQEEMATGTGGGRWCNAGVGDRNSRGGAEADREIGNEGMVGV